MESNSLRDKLGIIWNPLQLLIIQSFVGEENDGLKAGYS